MSRSLVFEAPAALTGTVAIQAAADETAAAGAMKPVSLNGVALTIPANTIQQFDVSPGSAIRLLSGSAEGADRIFNLYALLWLSDGN